MVVGTSLSRDMPVVTVLGSHLVLSSSRRFIVVVVVESMTGSTADSSSLGIYINNSLINSQQMSD